MKNKKNIFLLLYLFDLLSLKAVNHLDTSVEMPILTGVGIFVWIQSDICLI